MRRKLMQLIAAVAVLTLAAAVGIFSTKVYAAEEIVVKNYDKIVVTTKEGNGNTIEKADGYQKASFVFTAADGTVLEQTGKIKVRGNSTSKAAKKPFNIKLDEKEDLFGMGKGKKWCLLANCFDPTLIRNYLAFNFATELGLPFTSESRFVELYVDGIYKGCYLFSEPIETGKTRIDIDPEETSDFLIEFEAYRNEDLVAYITADNGDLRWAVSEPEMPDPSDYDNKEKDEAYIADKAAYDKRVEEISKVVNNVVDTIKEGDIKKIRKVIDVDSFAKYYVLNEFFKTCDFNWSSVNFYYTDGKLYAGPAWDYDLSTGNVNPFYPSMIAEDNIDEQYYVNYFTDFIGGPDTDSLYARYCNIYFYLCQCEDFMKVVGKLYESKQDYIKNMYAEAGMIDSLCKEYDQLFEENFTGIEAGGAGWNVAKSYADTMRKPDATFEENIAFLTNWLSERNEYLSKELTVKPIIIYQPENTTALVGQSVGFSVWANGIQLKYQWQYLKPGATKWKNMKDANDSVVFINNARKSKDGYQYRCVIKNSEGKVISDAVTLNILKPSEIKAKLVGYTFDLSGKKVTFNYKLAKDVVADDTAFLNIVSYGLETGIKVSDAVKSGKGKNAVYSFTYELDNVIDNYINIQFNSAAGYSPVYGITNFIQ